MRHLFVNGPVQNGPFTFDGHPGKAVGVRLAAVLNGILGVPPAPHLWNTVTLAGDLRYRQAEGTSRCRSQFEAELIADKYAENQSPSAGIMTDADGEVADLALEMIECNLRAGVLRISRETVATCRHCGHMVGSGSQPCKACGGTESRDRAGLHLVAEPRPGRPVLDRSDIHAHHRQWPKHLQHTAGDVAPRLILSRTRDHGIQLAPFGLTGVVLDPRAGIHATVLAAARRHRAEVAVMTITQNAANHVAAHGVHFRRHNGIRLQYALHGHLPYDHLAGIQPLCRAYRATSAVWDAFVQWFLPLVALRAKTGTKPGQLAALFKHYMRAYLAQPAEIAATAVEEVRRSISAGGTDWITDKHALANVMVSQAVGRAGDSVAR